MQVLIAHRFALLGQALIGLLAGRKPTHSFVPVQGMAELEQALRAAPADLLLTDLGLEGLGGADGLRPLREAYPRLRLVVLAETDDPSMILACLAAGAHGYVLQSGTPKLLLQALETVECGGVFVPTALPLPVRVVPAAQMTMPAAVGLTERQREVLRLLSGGQPTKAIARAGCGGGDGEGASGGDLWCVGCNEPGGGVGEGGWPAAVSGDERGLDARGTAGRGRVRARRGVTGSCRGKSCCWRSAI
jgi:DNA-binding NarL/FixJ family response regulator